MGELTQLLSFEFPGNLYKPLDFDNFESKNLEVERKIGEFYTIYSVKQDIVQFTYFNKSNPNYIDI